MPYAKVTKYTDQEKAKTLNSMHKDAVPQVEPREEKR